MGRILNSFERQICSIQGRLFELSLKNGFDSPGFVGEFMNSRTAGALDESYDRIQWAGEYYIMEEFSDEMQGLPSAGTKYSNETLFWMGYTYRYWNYITGESSKELYSQADAMTMCSCYRGLHTLDVGMAIEDLKDLNRQKSFVR